MARPEDRICPPPWGNFARMKSVPQTKKHKPIQQEFPFSTILLEPELQEMAGSLGADERLRLADDFERWAHELRVTAQAIKTQAVPWKRKNLPRTTPEQRALN